MELSNGKYRAKAKEWTLGEAGDKGTPEVAVYFVFTDSELAGQGITWHGFLTDAAADRTIQSLRYCGWTGDDLSNLTGLDANEVELVIENETYEGKTYLRVQWVNKPGGLAVKAPMTGDKAKAFAASMRDRIRALDAAGGVKRQPAAAKNSRPAQSGPPEPPPLTDADIPF